MRTTFLLLAASVVPPALPAQEALHAELSQVQTVYLLPMSNGLEQYIANHLTREGFYRVVTDPRKADAIFSDQLGNSFEDRMKELYPVEKPKEEAKKEEAEAKPAGGDFIVTGDRPRPSSFARGKGNIFLVDRRSMQVIWSVYARPKDSRPDELDRTSSRIVDRLQDALKPKKLK